jgi:hypothetical protein
MVAFVPGNLDQNDVKKNGMRTNLQKSKTHGIQKAQSKTHGIHKAQSKANAQMHNTKHMEFNKQQFQIGRE